MIGKKMSDKVKAENTLSVKHFRLMMVLNQWLAAKQEGKSLASFFEKNGYKKIAIYGMSHLGKRLVEELKGTDIEILYGIDKNADNIYSEFEMKTLEDDLPPVDVIVVTAVTYFDEIEAALEEKVDYSIISLEDILYEV